MLYIEYLACLYMHRPLERLQALTVNNGRKVIHYVERLMAGDWQADLISQAR